ncbi:nitrogen fixation protein NifQ [Paraburkholderia sp. D15]|uniref:nitrogen fixation protein NifQ n=1 Tax=Paraburkholderia sp. D15 TaxID=2880218 RepID=UPI0024792944|nr:nitrogen fixation protein NifQ [Paraburkholderia sp. D15]WGS53072.1 nitrogen fixation protein NifQ [Paraburkholderia sp. D15]
MSDNLLAVGVAGAAGVPSGDEVAVCAAQWLACATDPASADTQLFAKLIAARDARHELALLGLSQAAWQGLTARHFARKSPAGTTRLTLPPAVLTSEHAAFVGTLHALLLAEANPEVDAADAHCLATIVAHACLRPDHLWRDLGLRGRDDVTWMLTRYFPALVERNVDNLRWKKFLAAQRALSLGLAPGPAPGCPGCEDYGFCFAHPV